MSDRDTSRDNSVETKKNEPAKTEKFRQLLEEHHDWPCHYLFKFVAPKDQEEIVMGLFPDHEVQVRRSQKGNYLSFTVTIDAESPDLVIAIYEHAANKVKGLIAL